MNNTLEFIFARSPLWLAEPSALMAWGSRHDLTPTSAITSGKTLAGDDLPRPVTVNGICVVPITGPLVKSATKIETAAGFGSYTGLRQTLNTALATPGLTGILLHVDSPGGSYDGLPEAVAAVAAAAKRVRLEALVDGMAASAAFWLTTPAARITSARSSQVGSIGAVLTHTSVARSLRDRGIDATVFSSPEGKASGHPFRTLDESSAKALQARVDECAAEFRDSVLAARPGVAKEGLNGHVFTAPSALRLGLIESVGESVGEVLLRMTSGNPAAASPSAVSKSVMNRSAFDKLTHSEKSAFCIAGGKIT